MSVRERKWYDHDAIDKWKTLLLFVWFVAVVGPSVIGNVIDDPTTWHMSLVVVWILAVAVYGHSAFRRRFPGTSTSAPPRVDVRVVPSSDVAEAIASTSTRVAAVKMLRERHPGLNLADAVELVKRAT